MNIGMLVILAMLVYAGFAICTSRAGGRVDAKLSSAILNGVGAALPLVAWQVQRISRGRLEHTLPAALVFSVLSGAGRQSVLHPAREAVGRGGRAARS